MQGQKDQELGRSKRSPHLSFGSGNPVGESTADDLVGGQIDVGDQTTRIERCTTKLLMKREGTVVNRKVATLAVEVALQLRRMIPMAVFICVRDMEEIIGQQHVDAHGK